MMESSPIQPWSIPGKVGEGPGKVVPGQKGSSFQKILGNLIDKVNSLEGNANKTIEKLITEDETGLHQIMIAAEEADLAFRLMMEIRNKLVETYQEIMRMQV